jgi:hypothetical protein
VLDFIVDAIVIVLSTIYFFKFLIKIQHFKENVYLQVLNNFVKIKLLEFIKTQFYSTRELSLANRCYNIFK